MSVSITIDLPKRITVKNYNDFLEVSRIVKLLCGDEILVEAIGFNYQIELYVGIIYQLPFNSPVNMSLVAEIKMEINKH